MTRPRATIAATFAVGLACLLAASRARADAVDDAFAQGNAAAAQARWPDAIAAYERAATLLGKPSSVLSYDLGTAYAHVQDHGRATFHLRQALDFRGSPTADLARDARLNLDAVRRRAELAAATTGALIDRPRSWWDLIVETLASRGVGWLALGCGVAAAVSRIAMWRARAREGITGRSSPSRRTWRLAFWIAAITWAVTGALHAVSVRADRTTPRAIAVGTVIEAREGPGAHRASTWSLAGGAEVRIVDRTPGWVLVRLPGGIEGWLTEGAVLELDRPFGQSRTSRP
jgi:hypothetical protein